MRFSTLISLTVNCPIMQTFICFHRFRTQIQSISLHSNWTKIPSTAIWSKTRIFISERTNYHFKLGTVKPNHPIIHPVLAHTNTHTQSYRLVANAQLHIDFGLCVREHRGMFGGVSNIFRTVRRNGGGVWENGLSGMFSCAKNTNLVWLKEYVHGCDHHDGRWRRMGCVSEHVCAVIQARTILYIDYTHSLTETCCLNYSAFSEPILILLGVRTNEHLFVFEFNSSIQIQFSENNITSICQLIKFIGTMAFRMNVMAWLGRIKTRKEVNIANGKSKSVGFCAKWIWIEKTCCYAHFIHWKTNV